MHTADERDMDTEIRTTRSAFSLTMFMRRQAMRVTGLVMLLALFLLAVAFASWNVADPSLSYATQNQPTNLLGFSGAVLADLAMQFFGLATVVILIPAVLWACRLAAGKGITAPGRRSLAWLFAACLTAMAFACLPLAERWPLPVGLGGIVGDMLLRIPGMPFGGYPGGLAAFAIGAICALPALWLLATAGHITQIDIPHDDRPALGNKTGQTAAKAEDNHDHDHDHDHEDDFEEEDASTRFAILYGALTHGWLNARARIRNLFGLAFMRRMLPSTGQDARRDDPIELSLDPAGPAVFAQERYEPVFGPIAGADEGTATRRADGSDDDPDHAPTAPHTGHDDTPIAQLEPVSGRIAAPAEPPKPGRRIVREAQSSLLPQGGFQLPAVHLLKEPKAIAKNDSLSQDALEQNARMLEGVLEDFGVRGEIIHVRPGPVVTLYELEPAPGIKSSRVIGLADDIARSMSAIAARVAVVPGRNAIGIELPNQTREMVFLRELIASRDFEKTKTRLGLALGKTIGGESVIADLAKMPHLLVAGTTGSGKSVAINTMILSLLYRMPPDRCRLIMIDPKMLELSVYDGIPHLLSPVVTDPKKAVVALKWTVREMEDRYKKMSKLGVRNIDGFNARVEQAMKAGEAITRTVQTGFDRETGEAVYETEEFDLAQMPYIVVIIDEMADLMMVAGKDIEGAVQRLAQMARAAGIHVIMATQRPSVDVITGTIKANFPTRISFQVTSRIDSRTILGEQGAEQLLGMGDMLYMAGGGRIQRVHGPFVSDKEVEDIVAYLKTQGAPEYLDAITQDDYEDEGASGAGRAGATDPSEEAADPYDQAVAVVLRDGKASTSYIQRRLGIGYNRAASLIERMEQEGVIGPANHAGKREILVPTEEDVLT